MSFILNPYDNALDLSDKEDRKLFENGAKGLESVRLTKVLEIATDWGAWAVVPRPPQTTGNIFDKKEVTKDALNTHVDIVWANTGFRGGVEETPNYFKAMMPMDTPALEAERNQRKLKHVILGNMIWYSLTSNFQIELMAKETNFKQGDDFDRAMLWHQIVTQVKPSTKAAIGNLKDKLEMAKMDNFGHDIRKLNTWFIDQCNKIVREVGKEGYTEYLHSLFCAYKMAKDKEFLKAMKDKETKWVTVPHLPHLSAHTNNTRSM
eukprot:15336852-Ditylum_brightwellii.AAC.1